ncbi:MAG: response regulator transcription factor [Treponema sp.]|nr:response regulator transcription factor [Treponema sp.]
MDKTIQKDFKNSVCASIIIVEDHPIVKEGLVSYFEKTGKWRITGTASSLENAKELLSETASDILLLDIQLEDGLGLNIIPWLQANNKKKPITAVYTSYDDFVYVSAAISKGVNVYMCKRRSVSELENALINALSGINYIDDCVQSKLDEVADILSLLSKREMEIFAMIKSGYPNKMIAERLGLSRRTVENILSCIYDKTGVKTRAELRDL